jgi:Cu(I)/Ag(I) efflux system membrane fusion protein
MLMRVRLATDKPASRLLVPTEAVITTGRRSVVLVEAENNSIQPVEVKTGRDFGDNTEILAGLTEGQTVVASGQFLIDSEASLKAVFPKFAAAPQAQEKPGRQSTRTGAAPVYRTAGKIEKVTRESLTISHRPVPELKWPAMKMDFAKPDPNAFPDIKAGQYAEFSFTETHDGYKLEDVTQTGGGGK